MTKHFKVIADCREDFVNPFSDGIFNDHPRRESVMEFCAAAQKMGYCCSYFGGTPALIHAIDTNRNFGDDIFINMSDGLDQKNARIQIPVCCELLRISYSGCDPFVVALACNKHYAKLAVKSLGFLTPYGALVTRENQSTMDKLNSIKYPIIIKPNTEGSSIGIDSNSVAYDQYTAIKRIEHLLKYFEEVVFEEYIAGYEVTNLLVGNGNTYNFNEAILTSMSGKKIFSSEVFGMSEKRDKTYENTLAKYHLPQKVIENIAKTSQAIFRGLGMRDVARIDYRVTETGEVYFLEVNTVPRISASTHAGLICREYGISYEQFVSSYLSVIEKRLSINHA